VSSHLKELVTAFPGRQREAREARNWQFSPVPSTSHDWFPWSYSITIRPRRLFSDECKKSYWKRLAIQEGCYPYDFYADIADLPETTGRRVWAPPSGAKSGFRVRMRRNPASGPRVRIRRPPAQKSAANPPPVAVRADTFRPAAADLLLRIGGELGKKG